MRDAIAAIVLVFGGWAALLVVGGSGNDVTVWERGDGYLVRVGSSQHTLPACRHEDSPRCVWDARTRGNGTGRSFVALPGGERVTIDQINAR